MMRSTLLVVLTSILFVGCGKSETSSTTSGGSTSTQPASTNPSEGALFVPPNAPNVGIRPGTLAEYKPVVGKYGGRLIRDTLGEPKSFNPVTVGETSTQLPAGMNQSLKVKSCLATRTSMNRGGCSRSVSLTTFSV